MNTRPTIIDVARVAGVSKSTVSRVLQGDGASVSAEAREAVYRAIAEIGYELNALASSLRTDRTYLVMLVTPDITNPFWAEVARGFQDSLQQSGYSVVVGNSDWDFQSEELFLKTARRNRFDAIAINPTAVTKKQLLALGIPVVILGLRDDLTNLDMVGSDTHGGVRMALDYLYEKGHRRIGFIRGQHRTGRGRARMTAYREFLHEHWLTLDESLIVQVPFDLAGGRRAMQLLSSLSRPPTAVFASNDILALGAMQMAIESGLSIPADLSLVGMDDIYPAAMAAPGLTTVAKPKYDTGCQAAKLLLERMEGRAPQRGRRCVLPCKLVERGSVAVPLR